MKYKIVIVTIVSLLASFAMANELNEKSNIINKPIKKRYHVINTYSDKYSLVAEKNKFNFIDPEGRLVNKVWFDSIDNSSWVKSGSTYAVITGPTDKVSILPYTVRVGSRTGLLTKRYKMTKFTLPYKREVSGQNGNKEENVVSSFTIFNKTIMACIFNGCFVLDSAGNNITPLPLKNSEYYNKNNESEIITKTRGLIPIINNKNEMNFIDSNHPKRGLVSRRWLLKPDDGSDVFDKNNYMLVGSAPIKNKLSTVKYNLMDVKGNYLYKKWADDGLAFWGTEDLFVLYFKNKGLIVLKAKNGERFLKQYFAEMCVNGDYFLLKPKENIIGKLFSWSDIIQVMDGKVISNKQSASGYRTCASSQIGNLTMPLQDNY